MFYGSKHILFEEWYFQENNFLKIAQICYYWPKILIKNIYLYFDQKSGHLLKWKALGNNSLSYFTTQKREAFSNGVDAESLPSVTEKNKEQQNNLVS